MSGPVNTKASEKGETMRAITIGQPWAFAVIRGGKRIENRSKNTHIRGQLLIHAGASKLDVRDTELADGTQVPFPDGSRCPTENELVFGALIGVVDLVDCVPYEQVRHDPFASGPWCWVLANPRAFAEPIPWKGKLGFFDVPEEAVQEALAATADA
jgi:hypothetical protein